MLADSRPDQPHHAPLQRPTVRHARQLDAECTGCPVPFVYRQHSWQLFQGRSDSGVSAPKARIKMAHHPLSISSLMLVERYPYRSNIKPPHTRLIASRLRKIPRCGSHLPSPRTHTTPTPIPPPPPAPVPG